jgi:tetraacyldisaccharide 4'-kinase
MWVSALWQRDGVIPSLLSPLSPLTAAMTARRLRRPGWQAAAPVICCGNATVGGSGKTPLCLDILTRLRARGLDAHALSRGHGGTIRGPHRVHRFRDTAKMVGDEALLLAAVAPCWIGADRAESAREALAAGADALVMDDGLQNPTLNKNLSILVIDGGSGFGNGRLLPAGPLREPVSVAAARCQAAVVIGPDNPQARALLPPALPIFRATIAPSPAMRALAGKRVFAFAGIGRPDKFFATLTEAGVVLAETVAFSDHHRYAPAAVTELRRRAVGARAMLVTTRKDYVRLPTGLRAGITPLDAGLAWQDEAAFEALLRACCP